MHSTSMYHSGSLSSWRTGVCHLSISSSQCLYSESHINKQIFSSKKVTSREINTPQIKGSSSESVRACTAGIVGVLYGGWGPGGRRLGEDWRAGPTRRQAVEVLEIRKEEQERCGTT